MKIVLLSENITGSDMYLGLSKEDGLYVVYIYSWRGRDDIKKFLTIGDAKPFYIQELKEWKESVKEDKKNEIRL